MKYKLAFTLGDPSQDGHCIKEDWYITCNYSALAITIAYKAMCKKLGFNFLDLFEEYECSTQIPKDYYNILIAENIVDIPGGEVPDTDTFVYIFFNIIKHQIKDFEWNFTSPDFDRLNILDSKAYGLFHQ